MKGPKLLASEEDFDRARAELANHQRLEGGDGGGHIGDVKMTDRIGKVEIEVATIKGALDWAKLIATIVLGVMLAGFSLLAALTFNAGNRSDASASKLEAQIAGVSAKIADEFRAQRQEQAAQITAISNAITAAKQQPPQVLLVPAPVLTTQPPSK